MNETMRKSVRIHLRFIMTKVINRKTSCFFSSSSTFMFSLSWYRRSHRWCSRSIWKMDCINTYGSYNRTCKGDYVRPFQPCKDVNVNLTKTKYLPLNCSGKQRYTGDSHKKKLLSCELIDSTGRVSNCRNSNLKGPLGLLRSMLVQIILFLFFNEYVLFTILTYDRNYFHAVQMVNCHFNTSRTTFQVPQTCILEYVRNVHHQFSRISSENEIDVIKNCETVLNLVLLNTGVVFSLGLMEP